MNKYDGYHTAYMPEQYKLQPLEYVDTGDGIAFQYDVFDRERLERFNSCVVLYSELPWRAGFEKFERRAGRDGRSYNDFLAAIRWHIEALGRPAVLVTGIHAIKRLSPDGFKTVTLNGEKMIAMHWNCEIPDSLDATDLIRDLAGRFSCIGDFCCGYGRTARIARECGKRFIVSDYNGSCIRYIADTLAPVAAPAIAA